MSCRDAVAERSWYGHSSLLYSKINLARRPDCRFLMLNRGYTASGPSCFPLQEDCRSNKQSITRGAKCLGAQASVKNLMKKVLKFFESRRHEDDSAGAGISVDDSITVQ